MKKDIIQNYRKASLIGGAAYWKAKQELDKLKSEEKNYHKETYEKKLKEAEKALSDAESQANGMIRAARSDAERSIHELYKPNAADINPETVNLLKSGIKLTSAEIDRLMTENDSLTMKRIITDYADEHGIIVQNRYKSEEKYISQLDGLDSMARSGMQRDFYYNDIILNDDKFNEVAAGLLE